MTAVTLRELQADDDEACVGIIRSLPAWFGYAGAEQSVREAAQTQAGFAVVDGGIVVAFVTTRPCFDESLEITYLAVHADQRRSGHGRLLAGAVARRGIENGFLSVCLLTLGPSSGSSDYAETVDFYRSLGFWRSKEVKLGEWGGAPALIMTAPITVLTHSLRSGSTS